MPYRKRIYYSEAQKAMMGDCWQREEISRGLVAGDPLR